jgi:hypothetical protein
MTPTSRRATVIVLVAVLVLAVAGVAWWWYDDTEDDARRAESDASPTCTPLRAGDALPMGIPNQRADDSAPIDAAPGALCPDQVATHFAALGRSFGDLVADCRRQPAAEGELLRLECLPPGGDSVRLTLVEYENRAGLAAHRKALTGDGGGAEPAGDGNTYLQTTRDGEEVISWDAGAALMSASLVGPGGELATLERMYDSLEAPSPR